jgi:hypothetical protein
MAGLLQRQAQVVLHDVAVPFVQLFVEVFVFVSCHFVKPQLVGQVGTLRNLPVVEVMLKPVDFCQPEVTILFLFAEMPGHGHNEDTGSRPRRGQEFFNGHPASD